MPKRTDKTDGDIEPSPLPEAFRAFLASLQGSPGRVLVALSGGPDSVALLHTACEVARTTGVARNTGVAACWVDHGIRPRAELDAERSLVEAICRDLGVELRVESREPGALAREAARAGGVEAAARAFRYAALERARLSLGCGIVVTGHTADDLIETMVMRLCSGSGTSGLRGIPMLRGNVGRPFLGVSRDDIMAYLRSRACTYSSDSTNDSDDYLRNRLRHRVVPALKDIFPGLRSALAGAAEKARLDDDALESLAERLLVREDGDGLSPVGTAIGATAFDEAPEAVRVRALYRLCLALGASRTPWPLVLSAARSARREGRLASGAGLEFLRFGDRIVARPAIEAEDCPAAPGFSLVALSEGGYRIGKAMACRLYSADGPPGLRLEAFSWPLCLRSRRPGDSITTAGGTKKLDDLLAAAPAPSGSRRALAGGSRAVAPGSLPDVVVEDARGIVAVLPAGDARRAFYRRNDGLSVAASGYLAIELKGVVESDAIR